MQEKVLTELKFKKFLEVVPEVCAGKCGEVWGGVQKYVRL